MDQNAVRKLARPAPPRIDESKQPQALKDLFAGWRSSLAEPFRGITADGKVEAGLFGPARMPVSTADVQRAGLRFFESLTPEQRDVLTFDVADEAWRTWSNIHRNLMRHGLCLSELSELQRDLAYELLRASLGAHAYETARNAMRLNEHLAELTNLPAEFGEYFYWISFFGRPTADAVWGWQLDGHHCNINCLVLPDLLVLSPILLGSEPVTALSGVYQGVTVLREEEAAGWSFMASLSPSQQAKAVVGMELPFDGFASGFKDNIVVPYEGLPATELQSEQRSALSALIRLYTDRLPPGHADARLKEVLSFIDRTWFAWIGEVTETAPFYYRIYSPVIFIEFYHQPGVALPDTGYSRRHAHAMMRTPNGNDYGRAVLTAYRDLGSSSPS